MFVYVDDMEALVGQRSLAKTLHGKSASASFFESDSKETDLYGDSDKSEDGETEANVYETLYSVYRLL